MKFTFWNFPGEKTFFPTKPLSWREIPNCKFLNHLKTPFKHGGNEIYILELSFSRGKRSDFATFLSRKERFQNVNFESPKDSAKSQ